MNPLWYENRGEFESSWNPNEKAAAYLCDTSKWTQYYDKTKAKYAIACPSLEMYVDSYNQTHEPNSLCYRYQTTNAYGYGIGTYGNYSNGGEYTNNGALNTAQNEIYMNTSSYIWLASPRVHAASRVGFILGDRQCIGCNSINLEYGIRPLICLKYSTIPQIEL